VTVVQVLRRVPGDRALDTSLQVGFLLADAWVAEGALKLEDEAGEVVLAVRLRGTGAAPARFSEHAGDVDIGADEADAVLRIDEPLLGGSVLTTVLQA
jgi:hypothetical protein